MLRLYELSDVPICYYGITKVDPGKIIGAIAN